MAVVPNPHLHWLAVVQSVGDLHSRMPKVIYFLSHKDRAAVVETY
jgi:hypothetical protein